jgi:2-polyprenyl-6-methoxyphenol hydroxylase-like FAD-dependent oxidoreductase
MWTGGRRAARIPFEDMGRDLSRFPFVLMLGQDDNERIMNDHLRHWGLAVRWNTELLALEQHPGHVTAEIRTAAGQTTTVTARYVAGCDGVRSAVRSMNGIGFPGAPYEHVFFVADTEATGAMVPDELNVYLWRDGFHLYFPMAGTNRWRVIGILPEALRGRPGVTFDDVVPSLTGEGGSTLRFAGCDWFSTYHIHHRCTERFRDRRCFLLGDAAHVHSPMGGQGMNTGLQDAYNLAWKLAMVVGGEAGDALLDSYEAERMPVAHRLLDTTDRAFRFVVADTRLAGLFRTQIAARVLAVAMRRRWVRTTAFQTLSQLGIAYPRSPLSRTLDGLPPRAPRGGERFPWMQLTSGDGRGPHDLFARLDDRCFNLLIFGQPAPARVPDALVGRLRMHAFPADPANLAALARRSVPARSFYLLRPDGHVALAGGRYDGAEVQRWFDDAGIRPAEVPRPTAASVHAAAGAA